MEYYPLLSKGYKSEESDDPDSEGLKIHRPPWRSQTELAFFYSSVSILYKWMEEVDKNTKS